MGTQAVTKATKKFPSVFDDFFMPWNKLVTNGDNGWNRLMNMPAVNIKENKDNFLVSLVAPGLKKEDFKIDVDGSMFTISSKKEENKEEKDESNNSFDLDSTENIGHQYQKTIVKGTAKKNVLIKQ